MPRGFGLVLCLPRRVPKELCAIPIRGLPESTLEVPSAIRWIVFAQEGLDHPWTTPEPLHSVRWSPPLRLELLVLGGWESGQLVLTSPNSR